MSKGYPQPSADNIQEEAPCFRKFCNKSRDPEEPHCWGECMEDRHDYEWRKEQEEMDYRRKTEEWGDRSS